MKKDRFAIIADKIFGILKGSGFKLMMFDKAGNKVLDTHEATRFFATIPSHDPDLKEYNILIGVHDENADSHVDLKTPNLRNDEDFDVVMKIKKSLDTTIGRDENIKINWYKFDRAIKPRDDAYNNITESKDISRVGGTSKSSYQKVGNSRIIIRHTDSIDETKHGSRWRNVKAIFVENKIGERFLYPHMHVSGARALARHLSNDGTMHDEIGEAIQRLSSDYMDLKRSARLLHKAGHASTADAVKDAMHSVNKKVRRLSGPRGYATLSADIAKDVLVDEAGVRIMHREMMERCGCTDPDSDDARLLLVASRYLRENDSQIDDGIRFLSKPDLTSKANTFADQKMRLAWQVRELANCMAAGSTKDKLIAISTDLEDHRAIDPDEIDLIRKAFVACRHDSTVPFEPSEPELDRVRQLSGL